MESPDSQRTCPSDGPRDRDRNVGSSRDSRSGHTSFTSQAAKLPLATPPATSPLNEDSRTHTVAHTAAAPRPGASDPSPAWAKSAAPVPCAHSWPGPESQQSPRPHQGLLRLSSCTALSTAPFQKLHSGAPGHLSPLSRCAHS